MSQFEINRNSTEFIKKQNEIKVFEDKQVRSVWDDEQEEWYISIIDVIAVLTDQYSYQSARNYWKVLKHRLLNEENETFTNCNQLKMEAPDGKMRLTDVADSQKFFRLIQSIPSPKANTSKQRAIKIFLRKALEKLLLYSNTNLRFSPNQSSSCK